MGVRYEEWVLVTPPARTRRFPLVFCPETWLSVPMTGFDPLLPVTNGSSWESTLGQRAWPSRESLDVIVSALGTYA